MYEMLGENTKRKERIGKERKGICREKEIKWPGEHQSL